MMIDSSHSSSSLHLNLRHEFWKKIPAYEKISYVEFCDSLWQMKNSITSVAQLKKILGPLVSNDFYKDMEEGFAQAPMSVRITPYVLSLMNWSAPETDPLRKQFIPIFTQHKKDHPELSLDTLAEVKDSPIDGFTHRYPHKALFLALDICPVYCRYCTRSYAIGSSTESVEKIKFSQEMSRYEKILDYIRAHPELEDIVLSGGDAYMLRPERLKFLGESLLSIPHIRRIRIATKGLAIMPMKILSDTLWYSTLKYLVEIGRLEHKEVCVHTHFSHPNEITYITEDVLNQMKEDNITIRNQLVLQRGVNDSFETLFSLFKKLSYLNVHPYYVYIHDLVKGVEDLRTTVQKGIELEKDLRGMLSGFNMPTFVVDAPGGGGKRSIHSFEHYNKETGISVFAAPKVKPGELFMYFDPLEDLSPSIQKLWHNPKAREEMKQAALSAVQV